MRPDGYLKDVTTLYCGQECTTFQYFSNNEGFKKSFLISDVGKGLQHCNTLVNSNLTCFIDIKEDNSL